MKRMTAIIAGAAIAVAALTGLKLFAHTMTHPKPKDKEGHVLTALWLEYADAQNADRPLLQTEILERIKTQAKEQRLAWDFWDAATKSVKVQSGRNWKLQDSLKKALMAEAMAFPDPMVGFACWHHYGYTPQMFSFANENMARLSENRNESFYRGDSRVGEQLSRMLPLYIENDYEYALWTIALGGDFDERNVATDSLRSLLKGRYPAAPYLEYKVADRMPTGSSEWQAAMKKVVDEYSGKAVSLYPLSAITYRRLWDLQSDKKASQNQFKELRRDLDALENQRRKYSGSEAAMVADLKAFVNMQEELDSKNLTLTVTPEKATIGFRNTGAGWLTMENDAKPGKVLFRKQLKNTSGSYYVYDTVTVTLPDVGDGVFKVSIGSNELEDKEAVTAKFQRYSYALSVRRSEEGYGFFAANAATGLPLEKVELVAKDDDGKEHCITVRQGKDGYSPVPRIKGIGNLDDCEFFVRWKDASGFVRMSPSSDTRILDLYTGRDGYDARLFLNTAAFHPGEVLKFKGLVFKTLSDGSLALDQPAGKAEVTVRDPSGKEYFKQKYDVSEMGSLAGEFTLPQEAKTGIWNINIRYAGMIADSRSFYYGDFVLPSFACTFQPFENAFFPGDTVHVRGCLESYDGHKLSEAKVEYSVNKYDKVAASGILEPDADGRFDFSFIPENAFYDIKVKVTGATGETLDFSTYVRVNDYVRINCSVRNIASDYKASIPVVTDPKARFEVSVTDGGLLPVAGARFAYKLYGPDSSEVLEGEHPAGEELLIDLSGLPDGCYELKTRSVRENPSGTAPERKVSFIKYTPGGVIPEDVKELFWRGPEEVAEGGDISFCLGSGTHPVWAAVELYSPVRKVLWSKTIFIAKGHFDKVSIPYDKNLPGDVCIGLVFFNDYEAFEYDAHYYVVKADSSLPLVVKTFRDEARPGADVTVELETRPGAEAVASVWDKASDEIFVNRWDKVYVREVLAEFAPHLNAVKRPGAEYEFYRLDGIYGYRANMMYAAPAMMEKSAMVDDAAVESDDEEEVSVRSDFSGALAFEPFLRADAAGKLSFSFRTSDKLSAFRVAVFAHDSLMRNNLIEKELKVTLPVKVDVLKPEYLVAGDSFTLTATVSSSVDRELHGRLMVYRYDGSDYKALEPVSVLSADVTVPASGAITHQFDLSSVSQVPLGLLVSFQADDGTSDAMFFAVPVLERAQTLTEAHSAVLFGGADKNALIKELEGRFTGTSHYGAVQREISVVDMVKEVLEGKLSEPGNDVLSLTEALYVRTMLSSAILKPAQSQPNGETEESLLKRILALQNEDGGFVWFKGFRSSPILTAIVLERFHKMGLAAAEEPLSKAVKYLDDNHFGSEIPYWRGGISDAQYMYVRALYADVPFDVPKEKTAAKKFADFKKDAREYLIPEKKRGLNANIMGKARRLNTLRILLSSDAGKALSALWGVASSAKMEKSLKADVTSLLEYAVRHKDGGWYYPNAVMPWRGLLETEAYAHAQLADLLAAVGSSDKADGIRLWLMLQKETQHWDLTPHFVDAVACILAGSREVLDTKVLTLSKTYRKPLEEIVAAGNGFTIRREFFREVVRTGGKAEQEPISLGQTVQKGDKIVAVYHVYNAQNRSFVRLRAPREATLRPADQLSGYNWRYYKEVRTSWTDFYFDSMAEEYSDIREEFYVTQTGTFACGVPEIESLYANHYRANDAFRGTLSVK